MGDEKYYTIQVKGTAYRFKPLLETDIKRVVMMSQMDPTGMKSFKLLCRVLSDSCGHTAWSSLLDRFLTGELNERDLSSDVFNKLLKRQDKDSKDGTADADAE